MSTQEAELSQPELKAGCTAEVDDLERRRLLWLMAEYFRVIGCTDIKARLPGFEPPAILSGTLEDHRPDLTCRQSDSAKTPLIVEIVPPEALEAADAENRWSLLASAARMYSAELHLVTPKWTRQGAVDQALRKKLEKLQVQFDRLWLV